MRTSNLKFRLKISNLESQITHGALVALSLLLAAGCSTVGLSPATQPAATQASSSSSGSPAQWQPVDEILGRKGELRDGVYTIRFPRDDLAVTIDGMDVPTAAGIESTFRFYQCKCGKTVVLGQFVLADYEANDVVYALQKQDILVSSVGPFLLYENPRLMEVRFQSEGEPRPLAEAIKSALNWTAKNRMPPRKLDSMR